MNIYSQIRVVMNGVIYKSIKMNIIYWARL